MTGPLAISFTAARDLDEAGHPAVLNVLAALPPAGTYITGGAIGGDAFTGRWLAVNHPAAGHVVICPADKSRVDPWWLTCAALVNVIPMPAGTTYADRNAELVKRATFMCGLPAYPENDPRSRRSGTWQTIRMARRAGKLHRWDCVKPPYHGQVEACLHELRGTLAERNCVS